MARGKPFADLRCDLSSRYGDPAELAVMRQALAALSAADRRSIESIWCNSKNGWFVLTMRPGRHRAASRIGAAVHHTLVEATGGYCMLTVKAGDHWEDFDGGDELIERCIMCGCCGCLVLPEGALP